MRGVGSKEGKPPCAWEDEIRRRECEDFAPRNGATRVSGEWGAKRKSRRAPGRTKSGGGNVKILLPGTEPQGLAESGEQRGEAAGWPRGRIRRRECEDFAPRNGATRVSGERGAKRGHRRALRRLRAARPATLRAVLRNMYKKKLAFLYTIMYYHTNFIKNT